jgi:hypothetical protein
MGSVGARLYVSLRAADPTMRADRALRRALHGTGVSGGHGCMAGGQVGMTGMTPEEKGILRREFVGQFLRSVRVKDREGHLLVEDGRAPR